MGTPRCGVIGGPAYVTVSSMGDFVSVGDIVLEATPEFATMSNSLLGEMGRKRVDMAVKVRFRPVGLSKYIPWLDPWNAADISNDIMGCTDDILTIKGKDGTFLAFKASGLSATPDIHIRPAGDGMFTTDAVFDCVIEDEGSLAVLNSILSVTTGQSFTLPADAANRNLDLRFTSLAWGASPYDAIETSDEGIIIRREYQTEPRKNGGSTYGHKLTNVITRATFTPRNLTTAELLGMIPVDGPAVAPGSFGAPQDLVLVATDYEGGTHTWTLYNCQQDESAQLNWSRTADRAGAITMRADGQVASPYARHLYEYDEPEP